jgi:ribosomal protein S18 acetylase RimI-like enzyme
MSAPFTVVKLDHEGAEAAAQILARAFSDSPAWTWFCPDEERRRTIIVQGMRTAVRWGLLLNETHVTAPAGGVAIWEPPTTQDANTAARAQRGWDDFFAAAGPDVSKRMNLMNEFERPMREEAANGRPHWSLSWIGVDPPLQRTGAGSALLKHVLARLDASGTPCILDTERQRNVPFYERHGFAVTHHGVLPDGGPPYWIMLREPVRRG